jgi:hypothetical protein
MNISKLDPGLRRGDDLFRISFLPFTSYFLLCFSRPGHFPRKARRASG